MCSNCKKEHVCGFDKVKNEYRKWCSPRCQSSDSSCISKSKSTRLKLYGNEKFNGMEKSRTTRIEKYGSWHGCDFAEKTKKTKLDKYGDENFTNTEKARDTKRKIYGDSNYNNPVKNYITRKTNFYMTLKKDNDVEPMFTEEEYVMGNKRTSFEWRCRKCGNTFKSPLNYNFKCQGGPRVRCFSCFPIKEHSVSDYEIEIREFVSSVAGTDVMFSNRDIIHPYELDIVVPERKIAIEFDGLYWHSDANGKNPHTT